MVNDVVSDVNKEDQMTAEKKFIRIPEILEILCVSRTTLSRLIKNGKFPKGRMLSARLIVWERKEVEDWISPKKSENKDLNT